MADAILGRPPVIPLVPADVGDVRGTLVRFAGAINNLLRGGLAATIQVTCAANATTSVFSDSRVGPYTYIGLMPMTAHAADHLPSIWIECTKGSATIHHASSTYTDLAYVGLFIG